jgi:NAD(P)-dependent dehydrogenase (short-subunit alcohol dehydrogenase family)
MAATVGGCLIAYIVAGHQSRIANSAGRGVTSVTTDLRFDGRVAIVTGSSQGIGHATARLLGQRGARVVVNGRRPGPVEATVAEIRAAGGQAIGIPGDVASIEEAGALVSETLDRFGELDIVINNAGILDHNPFSEMSRAEFDRIMNVNLGGVFNVTRAAWPHLLAREYGRVLVISSQGIYGTAAYAHYSASKGALFGLMRTLSIEGRDHGINVNAVIPFAFTPMMEMVMRSGTDIAEESADVFAVASEALPPDLAAPPITWLAHESCAVTGEMLHGPRPAEWWE